MDATTTPSSSFSLSLSGLERSVGSDVVAAIQSSKILLVGGGGIGCELLKNLALSGFRYVEVIDLDTIDVSNLNRQLLFRKNHVGMSKCIVGCQVSTKIAQKVVTAAATTTENNNNIDNGTDVPPLHYVAHHGNVCDNTKFNVHFVSKFDVVLNALDNITARRRVNRLCLASNVPLIEAGTTGYLGQVSVIHKSSNVACYECKTQETQKVYPICTIRSTPSMPVHTIVWAKELYKLLFGKAVQESMLYEGDDDEEDDSGTDGANDKANGNKEKEKENGEKNNGKKDDSDKDKDKEENNSEPSTFMPAVLELRSLLSLPIPKKSEDDDANNNNENKTTKPNQQLSVIQSVLDALYITEINKQLQMGRYKGAKKRPTPLQEESIKAVLDNSNNNIKTTDAMNDNNAVWSQEDCIQEFTNCVLEAFQTATAATNGTPPSFPSFDKDDMFSMKFVTAASNLRSYVFGIEPIQSYYSAKGIAGNIIPAIATTNAIVAGIQILQLFQILRCNLETKKQQETEKSVEFSLKDYCKYVNCIRSRTRNGLYITASTLEQPNPKCFVCRNATISCTLNIANWTLQDFLQKIIKSYLGFEEPTIMLEGDIIWEEGDDSDEDMYRVNLAKLLKDLPGGGIQHGTMLRLEDFTQDLEVDLSMTHVEVWKAKEGEEDANNDEHKFEIGGDKPKAICNKATSDIDGKKTTTTTEKANGEKTNDDNKKDDDDDDDDDIVMVVKEPENKKRPIEKADGDNQSPAKKRAKIPMDGDCSSTAKVNETSKISKRNLSR